MQSAMITSFALYFVALIGIGIYFTRKKQNAQGFMLGNRSVNYWVTAIATQSSDMGAWLFMGYPAMVYTTGLLSAWSAISLVIGMFCAWNWVAPRIRTRSEKTKTTTLPSFIATCCGDKDDKFIRITGALVILYFSTYYIASGLVGLSLLCESAFGIDYHTGIIISLATATLYTLLGGFVAVAWCDFFQGMFLLAMILLVPIFGFFTLPDGLATITQLALKNGINLSLFTTPKETLTALYISAGWGLGYLGQPHILMNFMGIDDASTINQAKRIGITWQITVLTAATAIGLVGMGMFGSAIANDQLIFIEMTTQLFPPFLAGLILCAIIAAVLSTIDSLILAAGSTVAQDLMPSLTKQKISDTASLTISRLGALLVSFASLYVAWDNTQSVYALVEYAWSGFGATFGPILFLLLFTNFSSWKETNPDRGVFWGLLLSTAISVYGVYPLTARFILGIVIIIGFAWDTESD